MKKLLFPMLCLSCFSLQLCCRILQHTSSTYEMSTTCKLPLEIIVWHVLPAHFLHQTCSLLHSSVVLSDLSYQDRTCLVKHFHFFCQCQISYSVFTFNKLNKIFTNVVVFINIKDNNCQLFLVCNITAFIAITEKNLACFTSLIIMPLNSCSKHLITSFCIVYDL